MLTRVLSNLILTVLNPSCKFSSGGFIRDPKQVRQWSRISWSPYFRTTSTRWRERSFLALRELFTFGAIISVCLTVRHFVIHTLLIYGKGANPGNVLLPSNYARHAHQMIHNCLLCFTATKSILSKRIASGSERVCLPLGVVGKGIKSARSTPSGLKYERFRTM